ncbi:DUF3143 domain-containing protein [Vulcanococcus sp.]|jgi:hypothetical protein|uniref:DUF3143 domain-containing protein n=1 Tax=Vulcanococcus sp. TaxID=2856995 RepID=UPI0037DA346B
MTALPPPQTPLYNHPLPALEQWLVELGALQAAPHSCHWRLERPDWTATLVLEVEELSVRWSGCDGEVQRQFPYGFSRADVEAAILAGP